MPCRISLRAALLALVAALLLAAPASATDSDAPPGAPAHWLPDEQWVWQHWLPYDEDRLYSLLHVTRGQLWQQLRDDRRNVAGLAAQHGWTSVPELAAALVAPRKGQVSASKLAVLEQRAERTITQ